MEVDDMSSQCDPTITFKQLAGKQHGKTWGSFSARVTDNLFRMEPGTDATYICRTEGERCPKYLPPSFPFIGENHQNRACKHVWFWKLFRPRLDKPRSQRPLFEAIRTEGVLWWRLEAWPNILKSRFMLLAILLIGGIAGLYWGLFGVRLWLASLLTIPSVLAGFIAFLLADDLYSAWVRFWLRRRACCPSCRARLRTGRARQCFECGFDWHANHDS
jgi:hypothetical protein